VLHIYSPEQVHVLREARPALVAVGDAALKRQAVGVAAADRVRLVEVLHAPHRSVQVGCRQPVEAGRLNAIEVLQYTRPPVFTVAVRKTRRLFDHR
jgi:hypothetical protein